MGLNRAFVAGVTFSCVLAACSARTTASGEDGSTGTGDGSSSSGSTSGGSSSSSGSTSGGSTSSTSSSGDGTTSGTGSSSGSTTDPGGTTGVPTDDDGGAFISEPDGGHPIIPPPCEPLFMQRSECDPMLQDCAGDHKCTPWGYPGGTWFAYRCAPPASDPKEVGEICRVFGAPNAGCDDCVAGAMCLFVPETDGEGTCVGFCEHSPQDSYVCSEDGKVCAMANNGALPVCLDPCNPLSPGCPPEAGCLYIHEIEGFACAPPWTDLGYGEGCSLDLGSCAAGLACVAWEAFPEGACPSPGMCCTAVCDLNAPNACPHAADGQVCTPLYEPGQAPPGSENVGLCKMP